MQARKKVVMVEGNIGAGKSTFLNLLQKNIPVDVILEPTHRWQDVNGAGNLLELFYKDIQRWGYTFQLYAFITRIQEHIETTRKNSGQPVQVLERSVYCDRYCFARNCYEMGNMSDLEWSLYKEIFEYLVEEHAPKPDGFIYLRANPEVCYERLVKRNRSEESSVPLSYLTAIHNRHEEWLIEKKGVLPFLEKTPVLVIDCNQEFETDPTVQSLFIKQLQEFITSIDAQKPIEHYNNKLNAQARL